MKLGTLRNGRPDGQLIVLSTDLSRYVSAGRIAPNLQAALDNWDSAQPALEELARSLDEGAVAAASFDPALAAAPLPRAFQRLAGKGYLPHGARQPQPHRPMLHLMPSDALGGPTGQVLLAEADGHGDVSAEVAVILGPVAQRPSRDAALAAVRLVVLLNGFAFLRTTGEEPESDPYYGRPAPAFAPAAVTPSQLGDKWRNGRLDLAVRVMVNAMLLGQPNAGTDMAADFGDLIMAAAHERPLAAGTILSAGTIANRHDETPPIRREGTGFASIADARAAEKAKYGRARTPFVKAGDHVRIWAVDRDDKPVFGTIEQAVVAARGS